MNGRTRTRRSTAAALVACALAMAIAAPVVAHDPSVSIQAEHAAVFDPLYPMGTGSGLWSRLPDEWTRMASTTKVMTAETVLELADQGVVDLDDPVTISMNASLTGGSALTDVDGVKIRIGEVIRLHDLLYGLMIPSGNNAAEAIAEHVSEVVYGVVDVDNFVFLMNKRADELGLDDSVYTNPSGFAVSDLNGHHTTARDLARLWSHAMTHSEFRDLVRPRAKGDAYEFHGTTAGGMETDYLLSPGIGYLGAEGWKNGGKNGCGIGGSNESDAECFVVSAKRLGRRLVAAGMQSVGNVGNGTGDPKEILDLAYARLFHPAYRGASATAGTASRHALACPTSGRALSAVVPATGRTRLVSWSTNVGTAAFTRLGTGVAPSGLLGEASASRDVDILALTGTRTVTATRVGTNTELRLWSVPSSGAPAPIGSPRGTRDVGVAKSLELVRLSDTLFASVALTTSGELAVKTWRRTSTGLQRLAGRTVVTTADTPLIEVDAARSTVHPATRFMALVAQTTGNSKGLSIAVDPTTGAISILDFTDIARTTGASLVPVPAEPTGDPFPFARYAIVGKRSNGALAASDKAIALNGRFVEGSFSAQLGGTYSGVEAAGFGTSGLVGRGPDERRDPEDDRLGGPGEHAVSVEPAPDREPPDDAGGLGDRDLPDAELDQRGRLHHRRPRGQHERAPDPRLADRPEAARDPRRRLNPSAAQRERPAVDELDGGPLARPRRRRRSSRARGVATVARDSPASANGAASTGWIQAGISRSGLPRSAVEAHAKASSQVCGVSMAAMSSPTCAVAWLWSRMRTSPAGPVRRLRHAARGPVPGHGEAPATGGRSGQRVPASQPGEERVHEPLAVGRHRGPDDAPARVAGRPPGGRSGRLDADRDVLPGRDRRVDEQDGRERVPERAALDEERIAEIDLVGDVRAGRLGVLAEDRLDVGRDRDVVGRVEADHRHRARRGRGPPPAPPDRRRSSTRSCRPASSRRPGCCRARRSCRPSRGSRRGSRRTPGPARPRPRGSSRPEGDERDRVAGRLRLRRDPRQQRRPRSRRRRAFSPSTAGSGTPKNASAPSRHALGNQRPAGPGFSRPQATGISGRPNAVSRRRVFRRPGPQRTSPVPLTVIARTSTAGSRSSSMIARTSSGARSVSITIGRTPAAGEPAGDGAPGLDGDAAGDGVGTAGAQAATSGDEGHAGGERTGGCDGSSAHRAIDRGSGPPAGRVRRASRSGAPALDPQGGRRGTHGADRGLLDVTGQRPEVHLVAEAPGVRRHAPLRLDARTVEAAVDDGLHPGANGLEDGEGEERRGRHGQRLVPASRRTAPPAARARRRRTRPRPSPSRSPSPGSG